MWPDGAPGPGSRIGAKRHTRRDLATGPGTLWQSSTVTQWLYTVARTCAQHAKLVIALWVLAAVAIIGANQFIGSTSQNSYVLQGTDSATAQTLLTRAFPGSSTEANPVVLYNPNIDFGAGGGQELVNHVAKSIKELPSVAVVTTPADQPALLSADRHTAIVQVVVSDGYVGQTSVASDILTTAQQAAGPDTQVAVGGILGSLLADPDTKMSEVIGLLAALIVLFVTLRRWAAVFIPLINAVAAVAIGLSVIQLLGRVVFIPDVAPTLGMMLGLGVGIDYALFLVTRHRRLLRAGFAVPDSAGRTAGTAGAATVFAGGTLIAAMCGLTLTGISFLAWLGYAAAIVVAIAMAASLTLVPALFGVMGSRVLPKHGKDLVHGDHDALDRSGWARLATRVTTHPWHYVIGSTLILLLLAAPVLTLHIGTSGASVLPKDTTARQANDLIAGGFGPGATAPLAVVVQMYTVAAGHKDANGNPITPSSSATGASADPRTQDPRLVALRNVLASTPGVKQVNAPIVSTDGGVAVIRVTPDWSASDPQTQQLVRTLRDSVLPNAQAGKSMAAHVGGVTAATNDLMDRIAERTPAFIFGVVLLAFLLLMIAYRSLLIPFKAACMNLISIAAAYGVVTVVFEWGWGAKAIGLSGPVPIDSYVPMMMFAVLFGLSMDYEVFLLTAFREHWERTGDMTVAIRRGLADTGHLVTAAALIMVAVFASFVFSDNATVKIFGVGLATAVFVDATIVRCLLVPSIMVLAQKGTWWLPAWLDRLLPQLHVEGDPSALDKLAATQSAPKVGRAPMMFYRPAAVIGTVVGVGLAWGLVSRLPTLPPGAGTAIAVSAVMGAVIVLLPPGFAGGSGHRGVRALGFAVGVFLGLIVIGFLSVLIPPTEAIHGTVTSWTIVVISLLVVLFVSRSIALTILLGAIATTVAYSITATGLSSMSSMSSLLGTALLPAMITIVVTSIVISFAGDKAIGPTEYAPDMPSDPVPQPPKAIGDAAVDNDVVAAAP